MSALTQTPLCCVGCEEQGTNESIRACRSIINTHNTGTARRCVNATHRSPHDAPWPHPSSHTGCCSSTHLQRLRCMRCQPASPPPFSQQCHRRFVRQPCLHTCARALSQAVYAYCCRAPVLHSSVHADSAAHWHTQHWQRGCGMKYAPRLPIQGRPQHGWLRGGQIPLSKSYSTTCVQGDGHSAMGTLGAVPGSGWRL